MVYDNQPTLTQLRLCRELKLKVIPSIYFRSLRKQLAEQTGVSLSAAGFGLPARSRSIAPLDSKSFIPGTTNFASAEAGQAEGIIDALDDKVSEAILKWFDNLYQPWHDIYYRIRTGYTAVNLCDEQSYGVWTERFAGGSDLDILGFQQWLQKKYQTIEMLNQIWNTQFISFIEIKPFVSLSPPFTEWSAALREWDAYRSLILTQEWGKVATALRKKYPKVICGTMPFTSYGIEGQPGKNYYSIYPFNWVGMRTGALAEHLFNKKLSDLDFIGYVYLGQDMDAKKITRYALDRNVTPLMLFEFNGTQFLKGLPNHPHWEQAGGWWGLPGIHARDYRARIALYPRWKAAIEAGGVAGFNSWNDYPSFSRITKVQEQELELLQKFLQ
jgi:hypothetical protein